VAKLSATFSRRRLHIECLPAQANIFTLQISGGENVLGAIPAKSLAVTGFNTGGGKPHSNLLRLLRRDAQFVGQRII
jgi:hypothetical protein